MIATEERAEKVAAADDEPPCHLARDLTDARGVARILLDGKLYTLRITRQRKLILTR